MNLLQSGGLKVGGKRIPLSLLAVIAVVGAALLLVRQLRSSQSALSVGTPPLDLTGSGFQAALDQLTGVTQSLQQSVGQLAAGQAAQTVSQGTGQALAPLAPLGIASVTAGWVEPTGSGWVPGDIPLYGQKGRPGSGDITWVPASTQLQVTGPVGPFGIPVQYAGTRYLIDPAYFDIAQGPIPASAGTGAPVSSGATSGQGTGGPVSAA